MIDKSELYLPDRLYYATTHMHNGFADHARLAKLYDIDNYLFDSFCTWFHDHKMDSLGLSHREIMAEYMRYRLNEKG